MIAGESDIDGRSWRFADARSRSELTQIAASCFEIDLGDSAFAFRRQVGLPKRQKRDDYREPAYELRRVAEKY
jgi:hypothetical protein